MGEVLLRHYLWAILVFTLVIVGGVSMIGILNDSGANFDNNQKFIDFNDSFNRLNEVTASVEGLQSDIQGAETDFGAFGVLNALISSSWQSLKLMFNSFSIMNDAYNGLSTVFGLPAWIPALLILAVIILIAFIIYSAIFQTQL